MIDPYTAVLCILEYTMPDNTATAAQIAEIGKWNENEADEMLYKLSINQGPSNLDGYVVCHNTSPITYSLNVCVANPKEDLEEYLAMR